MSPGNHLTLRLFVQSVLLYSLGMSNTARESR
jgi:hypothetical protein